MKVIYEYDDQTKRLLSCIQNAITCFVQKHAEYVKKTTFHIEPTPTYIQDLLLNNPEYIKLIKTRDNILDHAIPKTVIIKTDKEEFTFTIEK